MMVDGMLLPGGRTKQVGCFRNTLSSLLDRENCYPNFIQVFQISSTEMPGLCRD
jgi:hypothetical protein